MNTTNEIEQLFGAKTVSDGFWDAVSYADRRIKHVLRNTPPEYRHFVWDSFGALMPSSAMFTLADNVWKSHIDELLERASVGGDLTRLTSAEVLDAIRHTSLLRPLNLESVYIQWAHFKRVFPRQAASMQTEFDATGWNMTPPHPSMVTDFDAKAPTVKRKYEHDKHNSWRNLSDDERAAILKGTR